MRNLHPISVALTKRNLAIRVTEARCAATRTAHGHLDASGDLGSRNIVVSATGPPRVDPRVAPRALRGRCGPGRRRDHARRRSCAWRPATTSSPRCPARCPLPLRTIEAGSRTARRRDDPSGHAPAHTVSRRRWTPFQPKARRRIRIVLGASPSRRAQAMRLRHSAGVSTIEARLQAPRGTSHAMNAVSSATELRRRSGVAQPQTLGSGSQAQVGGREDRRQARGALGNGPPTLLADRGGGDGTRCVPAALRPRSTSGAARRTRARARSRATRRAAKRILDTASLMTAPSSVRQTMTRRSPSRTGCAGAPK